VPFRLGTPALPDIKTLAGIVHAKGALLSINHPSLPSGERCMGCGWTVPDTDYHDVDSIEVINGGTLTALGGKADSEFNGISFWQARLNEGLHLTGIGGSDDHDATAPAARQAPVGFPTTVIYADNLSQTALLDGLKKGRVFIDMGVGADRLLDLKATYAKKSAVMGESLAVPAGGDVLVEVNVNGMTGSQLEVILDGEAQAKPVSVTEDHAQIVLHVSPKASGAQWVRANIRDAAGNIEMISNPIYFTK
jgi:hypothetical protein